MKLSCEHYDHVCVVALEGDLTEDEGDRLESEMRQQIDRGARDFVLHLAEVETIDSRGIEALLWLQEQSAERLGQVRLAQPSETLAEALRVTRHGSRFGSHANVDEAIASLR